MRLTAPSKLGGPLSDPADLSLYVHWPYCARICPYCDFNVFKNRNDTELLPALLADLKGWREWTGPRTLKSLHFGGGTPSLMRPLDIAQLIDAAQALWGFSENAEIGLEANPLDAEAQIWRDFKSAGISRVSIGVQSFNPDALKFLGRDHDVSQAKQALEFAGEIFENFSADLIYGWKNQTQAQWDHDLKTAQSFAPPHLSAYQLTIEPQTAFGQAQRRGVEKSVTDDQSADFYDTVVTTLTSAGFAHYEVSNFAKTGFRSVHNMGYWQGRDYAGLGPGAHGRLTQKGTRYATIAERRPGDYVKKVCESGLGISERSELSSQEWAEEFLLMGLRVSEGIDLGAFRNIGGAINAKALTDLCADGFLCQTSQRVKATPEGRRVLNAVTQQLLT